MKAFLILLAGPAALLQTAPSSSVRPSPDRVLRERIRTFTEDRALLDRRYPFRGGRSRVEALRRRVTEERAVLERIEFSSLGVEGRIDLLASLDLCRSLLRKIEREKEEGEFLRSWVPPAALCEALSGNGARLEDLDRKKVLADLSNAKVRNDALVTAFRRKEVERPDPVSARRLASGVARCRKALQRWLDGRKAFDPGFDWWFTTAVSALDSSMKDLEGIYRDLAKKGGGKPGISGTPIGRERLLEELERERIAYTPEELLEIAKREMAWCAKRREEAAKALGFDADWKEALRVVKEDYVPPGRQPGLIRDLAEEAVRFLEERDLVTIPALAKEGWRLEMMSEKRQRFTPYFTGGEVISVAYPTRTMDLGAKWMTMRGNNRHFCRATVHHELIPGHHLQGFIARRHRAYRRAFRTPFLVEGWALYWELRLWDLGFAKDPKDRLGMLFWRMHRAARIHFSLSFHLGRMSAGEAVEFLVNEIGHERKNAIAEVRRSLEGGYPPLYQAAYLLGGLQLRALHRELVEEGGWTERAFHDAVLAENAIPIDLIRASLTGKVPPPGAAPSWRFYPLD